MLKSFKFKRNIQALFILLIIAILIFNFKNLLDILSWVQGNLASLKHFSVSNPFLAMAIFFIIRFLFAVASIPGTGVMTLLAGVNFGFMAGSILAITSMSLGGLVAFLLTRYLFKDFVKSKFEREFQYIDKMFSSYGSSLLFLLISIGIVPYFIINSFFAITPMKAKTYFTVSFLSIIPRVLIFTNAGLQLSEIKNLSDILNLEIVISLGIIGLIPILSKLIYTRYSRRTKEVCNINLKRSSFGSN